MISVGEIYLSNHSGIYWMVTEIDPLRDLIHMRCATGQVMSVSAYALLNSFTRWKPITVPKPLTLTEKEKQANQEDPTRRRTDENLRKMFRG